MKRSLNTLLPALLLLVGALSVSARPDENARRDTVLILHTNDIHSHLLPDRNGRGGLARIGSYVEKARKRRADVLLLDAGDGVTGTPASSIFRGRPIFFVMNAMGYQAMALGNHEFDNGWRLIEDYRRIAEFPILAANAKGADGKLLADAAYRVFDVDGVRVGVIGLISERTPFFTAAGTTEGVTFAPPAEALKRHLALVEKKSDIVVLLSHLGHHEDLEIAAEVPGIDVIVGGHSHTPVKKPVRVGDTWVAQAGSNGRWIGRLLLTVDLDSGTVLEAEGSLVPVDGKLPESESVRKAVAAWEDQVAGRVEVEIGRTTRRYSVEELKPAIETIFKAALKTDLAFQNPGGIRIDLPRGPITVRSIWTILPFENTLVTLRVPGRKLPDWAKARLGQVDPERVYTVATNSYVAGHLEIYFPDGIEGQVKSGLDMRGAVLDYVKKHGGI